MGFGSQKLYTPDRVIQLISSAINLIIGRILKQIAEIPNTMQVFNLIKTGDIGRGNYQWLDLWVRKACGLVTWLHLHVHTSSCVGEGGGGGG